MNTKRIPALVMLLAGAITVLVTYFNHYSLRDMLVALIIVLLIFLFIGAGIKIILDSFHLPQEDAVSDDGDVIEKQVTDTANEEGENEEGMDANLNEE